MEICKYICKTTDARVLLTSDVYTRMMGKVIHLIWSLSGPRGEDVVDLSTLLPSHPK